MIIHNKKVKKIREEARKQKGAKRRSSEGKSSCSEEGAIEQDFIAFDVEDPIEIQPQERKRKREEADDIKDKKRYISLDILTSFPKPPWSDSTKPYSSEPARMYASITN